MPEIGVTMFLSSPIRALTKEDFPTLGLPTIEAFTPYFAFCNCLEASSTFLSFRRIESILMSDFYIRPFPTYLNYIVTSSS